jgi:maleylacetate reductase
VTIPGFDPEGWDQPVVFGVDRIHDLGAELERLGRRQPLVVCSWRRRRSEEFRHLAGGLGITPNVFQGAEEHLPLTVVEAASRAAREHEADSVVSFGGGSAIDLGKAVAFIAEHGPEAILDEAVAAVTPPMSARAAPSPAIAHVAVPTTYSGAEATGCFFVSERQEKRRLAGRGVRPDLVIGDPSLTLTLPWKPTAGTGLTALAHCLEALCSPARTEWTSSVAIRSARSLIGLLPAVSKSPMRVRERAEILGAAYAAGVVSEVAGRGLHHALCTGLGGRTGIAHGFASGILLPGVMRLDHEGAHEGLVAFARTIGEDDPGHAAGAVEAVAADLGLPRRLREAGVFEEDLKPVAAWATERSAEARRDPGSFSLTDALAVLRAAW